MAWRSLAAAALLCVAAGAEAAEEAEQADLLKRFDAQERLDRGLSITGGTALGTKTAGDVQIEAETGTQRPARDDASRALDLLPEEAKSYIVDLPQEAEVAIRIDFALDSAAIRPEEAAKLSALCAVLRRSDIALLRIFGHTDASGGADYNLALSERRAEAVRAAMIGGCGIAAERLEAHGLGETFPIAGLPPRAGENRRVEFQIGK